MTATYLLVIINLAIHVLSAPTTTITPNTTQSYIIKNGYIDCIKPICTVICNTSHKCANSTINANLSEVLTLICSESNSCKDTYISLGASLSTIIHCTGRDSCQWAYFMVSNSRNVSLNCNNIYSCDHTTLHAIQSTNINVKCYHKSSCTYILIDTIYATSLVLICFFCQQSQVYCPLEGACDILCLENNDRIGSCEAMDIHIKNENSTINLNCSITSCEDLLFHCVSENEYTSVTSPQGMITYECYGKCCPPVDMILCDAETDCVVDCTTQSCTAHFINASLVTSLVTVICSQDNCQETYILCPLNSEAECIIECVGESACKHIGIHAGDSRSLELKCNGYRSCDQAHIYCPSSDHNVCSIQCSDDRFSCHTVTIYVDGSFVSDYLNIDCPIPRYINQTTAACDALGLDCSLMDFLKSYSFNLIDFIESDVVYYNNTMFSDWVYDMTSQSYQCISYAMPNCCPILDIYTTEIHTTDITIKDALPIDNDVINISPIEVIIIVIAICSFLCCLIAFIYPIYRRKKSHSETTLRSMKRIKSDETVDNEKNKNINVDEYVNIKYDINNYKQWNSTQFIAWIISVEDCIYKQYAQILITSLTEENVNGTCLNDVDMSDIKRWGIKDFKYSKGLLKHIEMLTNVETNITAPISCNNMNNVMAMNPSRQHNANGDGESQGQKRVSIVLQVEGHHKTTKTESAVHLQLNNCVDLENLSDDEKDDVLLEAMLSDVMKMDDTHNDIDSDDRDNSQEKH
eukprot:374620_1